MNDHLQHTHHHQQVSITEKRSHANHSVHDPNLFLKKFLVSLVLTLPVIVYSSLLRDLFGWQAPAFPGSQWIPLIFGSAVFFYGGLVFLSGAWNEIQSRQIGMMTLIALAIISAYAFSVWQIIIGNFSNTLFWELTTLIVIMLLGHWLEMRAVQGARGALQELSKLLPDEAEVVHGKETHKVLLSKLKVDDEVMIRPGGKIPADGVVASGQSEVNESLLSGESKPIEKKVGSKLIAGAINGNGTLIMRVESIGEKTFLSGVMRLVQEAEMSKSRLQLLSDRAAFYLTVIAIGVGLITLVTWVAINSPSYAVERLVAVLVITCPHALGLAVPLVAMISTSMAANAGVLIRKRSALETARDVDMVVFDKTGTLTQGTYTVTEVWPAAGKTSEEVLRYAAGVDSRSEHAVSQAIVLAARSRKISVASVESFQRLPGQGVKGVVEGKTVLAGNASLLEQERIDLPEDLQEAINQGGEAGKTIVYVIADGHLAGAIGLGDVVRPESKKAVEILAGQGIEVVMMTGDNQKVAAWAAEQLNIQTYFAEVLPQQKAEKVKLLQNEGRRVLFVGDGINDAPALVQADVGVAIGAGTNVAIESAGIVLVKNDPRDIPKIIALSKATYRKMQQNIFWATAYNVITLPLAAGVAIRYGVVVNPAVGAVFMSLSTIIVAINALLLRRIKLV